MGKHTAFPIAIREALDNGLFDEAILGAAHFYPIYPIIFPIIQFTISNPRPQEG
jgi:hypothetical protein